LRCSCSWYWVRADGNWSHMHAPILHRHAARSMQSLGRQPTTPMPRGPYSPPRPTTAVSALASCAVCTCARCTWSAKIDSPFRWSCNALLSETVWTVNSTHLTPHLPCCNGCIIMSGRRAHRSWPFPLSARLREIGAGVELDVDVLKRFRASASSFLTESHLCRFCSVPNRCRLAICLCSHTKRQHHFALARSVVEERWLELSTYAWGRAW
jgi:hypothetical protein